MKQRTTLLLGGWWMAIGTVLVISTAYREARPVKRGSVGREWRLNSGMWMS